MPLNQETVVNVLGRRRRVNIKWADALVIGVEPFTYLGLSVRSPYDIHLPTDQRAFQDAGRKPDNILDHFQ